MSSAKTRAERLQDFLDDRLSAAERTAFARELDQDATLRKELEAHQAIRAALRDTTDANVPGGLVAGARARFEASQRGAPRGMRWVSWEAAGLATAALLAVAVFLPGWLRQEPETALGAAPSRALPSAEEQLSSVATGNRQAQPPAKADQRSTPPVNRVAETESTPSKLVDSDAPGQVRERLERPKSAPRAPAPPPPVSPPTQASPVEGQRSRPAPAFAPEAGDRAVQSDVAEADVGEPANRSDELEKKRAFGRLRAAGPAAVAVLEQSSVTEGYALAPGRIEPGAWRIAEPGAPRPPGRWLLIGPREKPFACDGAVVEHRTDGYHVLLARPAPGVAPSPGGCAIALPQDDLPVSGVRVGGNDD